MWIALAYLALVASAVTTALISYAAQRLPSAKVMAYTYLVPSWVIIWEVFLGHGAPGARPLIGVVLTMLALGSFCATNARNPLRTCGFNEKMKTKD